MNFYFRRRKKKVLQTSPKSCMVKIVFQKLDSFPKFQKQLHFLDKSLSRHHFVPFLSHVFLRQMIELSLQKKKKNPRFRFCKS